MIKTKKTRKHRPRRRQSPTPSGKLGAARISRSSDSSSPSGPGIFERLLCHVQGIGDVQKPATITDDERDRDYVNLFKIANALAADPSRIERSRSVIGYRKYGHIDSKEQMPAKAYTWTIREPGGIPEDDREFITA